MFYKYGIVCFPLLSPLTCEPWAVINRLAFKTSSEQEQVVPLFSKQWQSVSSGDPLQCHHKTHPDTNAYGSDPHNCVWGRHPEMMLFHFCLNFFRWVVKGHDTWQHVRSEPETQWPPGLLQLVSTHYTPWTHIALDFVTSLPTSKNTTVILSILSRSAHFIASDKLSTASEKAKLLIDQVFQLHGIPVEMVSDRGAQFISCMEDFLPWVLP